MYSLSLKTFVNVQQSLSESSVCNRLRLQWRACTQNLLKSCLKQQNFTVNFTDKFYSAIYFSSPCTDVISVDGKCLAPCADMLLLQ